MRRRRNRPVFLIDIAVPRDVESAVNKVQNAYLYDIDDLQDVVASNLDERQREAVLARQIVEEEVGLFQEWLASLAVVPTLVALRTWATSVKDDEVDKFLAKMPELTDDERNKVGALAHSIVNKLLHPPDGARQGGRRRGGGHAVRQLLARLVRPERRRAGRPRADRGGRRPGVVVADAASGPDPRAAAEAAPACRRSHRALRRRLRGAHHRHPGRHHRVAQERVGADPVRDGHRDAAGGPPGVGGAPREDRDLG